MISVLRSGRAFSLVGGKASERGGYKLTSRTTKYPPSRHFAFTPRVSLDNVVVIALRQAVVIQGMLFSGVALRYGTPALGPLVLAEFVKIRPGASFLDISFPGQGL